MKETVLVELGPDVPILEHESLTNFVNLRLFEWRNLLTKILFFRLFFSGQKGLLNSGDLNAKLVLYLNGQKMFVP